MEKKSRLTLIDVSDDGRVKKSKKWVTDRTLTLETARETGEETEFLKAWAEMDQEFKANGSKAKPPEECSISFRKVRRKWAWIHVWRTVNVNLCSSCVDTSLEGMNLMSIRFTS